MRFHLVAAALVASAVAVPFAEPEPVTAAGYKTVTVTASQVERTVYVTVTAARKTSTVVVGPVSNTRTSSTSSKKSSTSSKKTTSTSSKKPTSTTSSKKTTSTSSKKPTSTTSSKKTTSTTSSKKTTSSATVDPVSTSTTSSKKTTSTTSSQKTSTTSSKASTTSSKASTTSLKASTTSSKASTTSTAASALPTAVQKIVVDHHNLHRSNHSAVNIKWSSNLASIAASIASSCVYAHNTTAGGGGYGQNIAAGLKSDNISSVITDLFYNGEMPYFNGLYGQASPSYDNFAHWGHFSQIVWKDTTSVGCAVQYCPKGLSGAGGSIPPYFTVCNYGPPGNYGGEYAANVGKPLGHPIAHWNTGL